MAQKSSSGSKRSQGGGRNPNSEPKIQVFKGFGGINFENASQPSAIDVDTAKTDGDQTDLQMNFMFLQNNVAVASNQTLVTRDKLVDMFYAPSGVEFTGPLCLIGPKLYIAKSDGNIGVADIDSRLSSSSPQVVSGNVSRIDRVGTTKTWSSISYYDNKLIAMTDENYMWTGDVSSYSVAEISNAQPIPDPTTSFVGHVTPKGDLAITWTAGEADKPFRIEIAHTYVNKYGPTKLSPSTVFYANYPVSEWHAGRYAVIDHHIQAGYMATATELYYRTDNASQFLFLGRTEIQSREDDWSNVYWSFSWYGYIDATSMWPIANLIAPTENYTKGVPASKVCSIDGRLYFWGDRTNRQRLYIGGNPGNLLSISPGTGGGFVDVEPGTGQVIRSVLKYKTQSGNSIVTMLCDSPNSKKDQRFNLVENNVSVSNEQSMKSWQAEQVAGAVGCKSYDGALVCQDGLYSISRYGLALTTMTMEYNSQIRTTYVSDAIKPIFTDSVDKETRLSRSSIIELDGIIYMALGIDSDQQGNLDNVLFCYDIDLKAWWTYTLDVDSPIVKLFHIDWQGRREGIGIVTKSHVYMLPTTIDDSESNIPNHSFLIESAQLSTQMPQQGWQYLSQLEFHFDRFVGTADIEVRGVDVFGRKISVRKHLSETTLLYDYVVHMRIDQRLMSYVIVMNGTARFRMTHFLARVYTLSNKVGQIWGFDDSISHRSSGSVHPTFKCYNDLRKAIFT